MVKENKFLKLQLSRSCLHVDLEHVKYLEKFV